jgi:hypothetical protein
MVICRTRSSHSVSASTLAITIGALIYLAYGPHSLLVFKWMTLIHADALVEQVRLSAVPVAPWVRHNLPDGLWVYAATLLLSLPWKGKALKGESLLWLLFPLTLATGAELGQAFHFIKGTFDPLDLGFYFLGCSVALLQIQRRNHETK